VLIQPDISCANDKQLAERLQVPLSWVYKKSAVRGPQAIPILRCGRYLRFCWPDVCAWLRSDNSLDNVR
jgi:hypothetical protein